MVVIGPAMQECLLAAAREHLGPDGEAILRGAAQAVLESPLEGVRYSQITALLEAAEKASVPAAGQVAAAALAADLDLLADDAESGLSGRMIGAVARKLGPSAEPFLSTMCLRLGIPLAEIDRTHLSAIAATVRDEAAPLMGLEAAEAVAELVMEAGDSRPAGLVERVIERARTHAGDDGEQLVRDLCHQRLEVELDEIPIAGIDPLARAVETDGAVRLAQARATAFTAAARAFAARPTPQLTSRLTGVVSQHIGPAGAVFLKRIAARHELPLDAIEDEQLDWLAAALAAEAAPLLGAAGAGALERDVKALIAG